VIAGAPDDPPPHALVHDSFGQWLIDEDGPKDGYGRLLATRYAWADEG
jgi:hypothetical protein